MCVIATSIYDEIKKNTVFDEDSSRLASTLAITKPVPYLSCAGEIMQFAQNGPYLKKSASLPFVMYFTAVIKKVYESSFR